MKLSDLTPEQKANIDAIVRAWIERNVEFHPENRELFRLRTEEEESEPRI